MHEVVVIDWLPSKVRSYHTAEAVGLLTIHSINVVNATQSFTTVKEGAAAPAPTCELAESVAEWSSSRHRRSRTPL